MSLGDLTMIQISNKYDLKKLMHNCYEYNLKPNLQLGMAY